MLDDAAMIVVGAAGAVAVAWTAGAAIVAALWPAREPLPAIACLGLAGLLGPAVVGAALLCAGIAGVPATLSVPLIAACAIAGAVPAWRRRRAAPREAGPASAALILVLALSVAWAGWVAARTHLGWDGTVVWYHKARIAAAAGGAMPGVAIADRTRAWTAPDYPLQVPLAMAWVRLWQPREDERALKMLPAAWCAAIFCLVAAAVRERSQGDPHGSTRAACAVIVMATAPRLLVGEGSLTSGYADGPLAGLLAATVWLAWRSGWGAGRGWRPLLALAAASLAWTKQEGLIAVAAVAIVCAWRQRHVSAAAFAIPATAIAGGWQAWAAWRDAPIGMAYAWPGAAAAIARVPMIVRAYGVEALDLRSWALLWPGLVAAFFVTPSRGKGPAVVAVLSAAAIGAAAFCLSAWPDVPMHLHVTSPRQLIQLVPSIAILTFSADSRAQSA